MIPPRSSSRPALNTTPTRIRSNHPPSEFTIVRTPRRKDMVSPNRTKNPSRVIIRNVGVENRRDITNDHLKYVPGMCVNHPEKTGKYNIKIDGEMLQYCEKCSAHLASQGFHVEKVEGGVGRRRERVELGLEQVEKFRRIEKQMPLEITNNHRMREVRSFVKECEQLKRGFNDNLSIFKDLPIHYGEQSQMIEEFYDVMMQFVDSLRVEHRALLDEQNRRYCQLAQIMAMQLEESNIELQTILEDIINNIKDIAVGISEERYRESMNYYLQKVGFFKARIEEQKISFEEVTTVEEEQLKTLIVQFKANMNSLLGIKDLPEVLPHVTHPRHTQPNHQLFRKLNTEYQSHKHPEMQVRDPFRTLFSEEEHPPEQSPHFKMI